MNSRQSSFVVDNATDGFSLHDVESGDIIRSFCTNPTKSYPKQVAFAERGNLIVGGGEGGKIHVFEQSTGGELQILRHSERGLVQTITVGTIR